MTEELSMKVTGIVKLLPDCNLLVKYFTYRVLPLIPITFARTLPAAKISPTSTFAVSFKTTLSNILVVAVASLTA